MVDSAVGSVAAATAMAAAVKELVVRVTAVAEKVAVRVAEARAQEAMETAVAEREREVALMREGGGGLVGPPYRRPHRLGAGHPARLRHARRRARDGADAVANGGGRAMRARH